MLRFDEENARRLEAVYMTPDVVEQRRAFRAVLAVQPGEQVLDIGSGPGILAAELAKESQTVVQGVDVSDSMLAMASRREGIECREGDATALPFADDRFDVAVSTQVYEYVEDISAALAEARRVLRPGGRMAILDTDWDAIVWHSSDRERMRRVLAAWNDHLVDPWLPRTLPSRLEDAGFGVTDSVVVPIINRGYDRDTYSAGMLEIVARYVPGRRGVDDAEAAAWADDLRSLGRDYFFSLNRYLFIAVKQARPGA
jgi:arsenite methyltransferase